ncbi:hypothetical protein ACROYT_G014243 [Oculina patagonica]
MYKRDILGLREPDEQDLDEDKKHTAVRTTASEIYYIISKTLNIMQLYIKGTGYIIENKEGGPFREFLERMVDLFENENFKTKLNRHVEKEVGNTYRRVLNYMDTERDKSAMKYILTKITSVKFAGKLQNTQNKCSLKQSRDVNPNHLRKFAELREDIRKQLKNKGGGGGLESHSKLQKELLYRAADNKTKMKDARESILALAPEDFKISLSTCFNYTQNYRKGTLKAKRHHEGLGVNACVSLHKAPDTAPVKDLVINIHWTSANVNHVLDEASKNPQSYCVDSRNTKQVIRANMGHGGCTWKNIQTPDHTFDTTRTNAVTPMTHLLIETKETRRMVTVDTLEHKKAMYEMREDIEDVLKQAQFAGKYTMVTNRVVAKEFVCRSLNLTGSDVLKDFWSKNGQWVGNHHNHKFEDLRKNPSHMIRLEEICINPNAPDFAKPHPKQESIWLHHGIDDQRGVFKSLSELREDFYTGIITHVNLIIKADGTLKTAEEELAEVERTTSSLIEELSNQIVQKTQRGFNNQYASDSGITRMVVSLYESHIDGPRRSQRMCTVVNYYTA